MTVSATPRKAGPFLGNGATTAFPFAFKVFDKTDIAVTLLDATGIETTLVLDSAYSVTVNVDQNASPGGSVTYTPGGSAMPLGSSLTITGNMAATQPLDIVDLGRFLPQVLENELDRVTILYQQTAEKLGRAWTVPVSDVAAPTLPTATARKGHVLAFDPVTGQPGVSSYTSDQVASALSVITSALAAINAGAVGPLDALSFMAAGTGARSRSGQDKMRDWVSVRDFGAFGDGASHPLSVRYATLALAQAQYPHATALTDEIDWCAFDAALTASTSVYGPPGNYVVNKTITMNGSRKLIGFSRGASTITNSTSNLTTITTGASSLDFEISRLKLTRSVTAAPGGNGIDASAICGESRISDLNVTANYHGLILGGTDYSIFQDSIVEANFGNGVYYTNANSTGALQWYTSNVISQVNGSHGFFMESVAGRGITSVASLSRCATFGNTGYGFIATGTPTSSLASIRVHTCFFGGDGQGEMFLDTYNDTHKITDTFMELPGSGTTGPGFITPATNTGNCITVTANNNFTQFSGCDLIKANWNGIDNAAPGTKLTNCRILNNGVAGTVNLRNGVKNSAATGIMSIIDCTIGNGSGTNQVNGISSSVDALMVIGCNLSGNTGSPLTGTTFTASAIFGNLPSTVTSNHPNGLTGFTSAGLVVGAATGGDKGPGTINNAGGSFKNNVAYTSP